MNKTSKFLAIGVAIFALGLSTSNLASAKAQDGYNIAVVDVQKVVVNSPQINALKNEQKSKIEDLVKFVKKAEADLAKEKNDVKKKSMEDAYNIELNAKKVEIDKDYAKKMAEIDKNVTDIINTKALDYDLVLTKTSVIKGGVDITNEIIKAIK